MLGAIVGGAIGAIGSTILGNNSAKHEAEKNRDFQEHMSNTSISRRMQDLRNAGLNPLLAVDSAGSGASTPSGSQAQLTKIDPQWITALANAKLQKQQGDVAKAEEKKINAEAEAQRQENSMFNVKADKLKLEAELQRQGILTQKTVQDMNKVNSLEAKARILVHQAQKNNINMSTEEAKRKVQLLDVDLGSFKNSVEGRNYFDFVNSISNPWNAGASAIGANAIFYNRAFNTGKDLFKSGFKGINNYFNNFPKIDRRIRYHGYKED